MVTMLEFFFVWIDLTGPLLALVSDVLRLPSAFELFLLLRREESFSVTASTLRTSISSRIDHCFFTAATTLLRATEHILRLLPRLNFHSSRDNWSSPRAHLSRRLSRIIKKAIRAKYVRFHSLLIDVADHKSVSSVDSPLSQTKPQR